MAHGTAKCERRYQYWYQNEDEQVLKYKNRKYGKKYRTLNKQDEMNGTRREIYFCGNSENNRKINR